MKRLDWIDVQVLLLLVGVAIIVGVTASFIADANAFLGQLKCEEELSVTEELSAYNLRGTTVGVGIAMGTVVLALIAFIFHLIGTRKRTNDKGN